MADEGDRRAGWLEGGSAVVLSVAALASSWASYQAGLWDGEQAAHYSQANALRIESSRRALGGGAVVGVEVALFTAWLDARARDQDRLAAFYEARFPRTFSPAFQSWMKERPLQNPAAPATPFNAPGYQVPGQAEAAELNLKAAATFEAGERANQISDGFEQSATILALAMFFGGIGQVFRLPGARLALLLLAAGITVIGLARLAGLPVLSLGFGAPA